MGRAQSIAFSVRDAGLASADIADVWTGTGFANATTSFTSSVVAHGALVYKFTNGVQALEYQYTIYFADAPSGMSTGGAGPRPVSDSVNVITNIGKGGTLTYSDIDGAANGGNETTVP